MINDGARNHPRLENIPQTQDSILNSTVRRPTKVEASSEGESLPGLCPNQCHISVEQPTCPIIFSHDLDYTLQINPPNVIFGQSSSSRLHDVGYECSIIFIYLRQ
ncbi:hypothetical protein SAMN05421753_104265 [Planctomicrobium piriforme]|uniref:Uncharacterized protein n=1 Tax=Planctomicrobium piriforme TaxID=1576369 RepID=A0A1I3EKJ4_9PLAN|nr:hypothetical protein SAMN05421753_104265 [Planctomicrobium piriforme]